ncbi:hypothetical protein FJ444_05710 [Aestuariibacter sp. GS-14]|uniref:endo-1,4-beta-xylanase n=1 Tax=Aestuariibacter sp. GS-14 TaxID=2590670 RepID=UPI00112AA02C|nr:endo-1,4-beta-xylanase [Aestuariibacter sp. GS-14]TPV61107.1 hypothetical protein FJ444_05710 [Aestuariibacter sp. GS-14]
MSRATLAMLSGLLATMPPILNAQEQTPIAEGEVKFLGNIHAPTQLADFLQYWDQVTPENAGKWGSVERERDVMNWAELDAAYQFAKSNNLPFKLHVLVWGNQQPAWIESLSVAEQEAEIIEWFEAVSNRYPELDMIEVVNEPINDAPFGAGNGNYAEALGGSGDTGWDWIIRSFELARSYFPNSQLLLNEYGLLNSPERATEYAGIIALLKARNLIDGVGIQAHAFSTTGSAQSIASNLQIIADTGVPVYITELDIDGPTDEQQLTDYKKIFPVLWEHDAVKGITLWGWRPGLWRDEQDAELVDENGNTRPALNWLRGYVGNTAPFISSGQGFSVLETAASGTVIGTLQANDADGNDMSFSLSPANTPFTVSALGDITVSANNAIDYESANTYTITVTGYDGYAYSNAVTVEITVQDADEAPVFSSTAFSVAENIAAGSVVAQLEAIDPEGATVSYSLSGSSDLFSVNSETGALSLANGKTLDYETATSHSVNVSASDGTLSTTEVIVINVTDINDTTPTPAPTPNQPAKSSGGGSVGWSLLGLMLLLCSRLFNHRARNNVNH